MEVTQLKIRSNCSEEFSEVLTMISSAATVKNASYFRSCRNVLTRLEKSLGTKHVGITPFSET